MAKSKEDKIQFELDTNESLANAIRRSANEIPNLAIEFAEIHKNDSALYDEIIAHRLGLVPIKTNRKLNEVEKCSCEGKGCSKCEIKLSLKDKGPCTVYSGDIKGELKPIHDKMPIVVLDKDQELELIAFARLGRGKDHAKYSPGLVYYRNVSEITVKNTAEANKLLEKIKPSLIDFVKSGIKTGSVVLSDEDLDYLESIDKEKALEIKHGEDIVFFIESWGQIPPKEIFVQAVKALDHNLKEVSKLIKK